MKTTAISATNVTPLSKTLRLTESAIMVAIATILSMFPIFQMPQGGDVTVCILLPIAIIAYRYGVKWGTCTAFTFGMIQLLFGLKNFAYVKGLSSIIVVVLFDYLIAFGLAGLAGTFRNKIKNQGLAISVGLLLATVLRYMCHVISGYIVWGEWAEGTWLTALCEKIGAVTTGQVTFIYASVYNSFVFVDMAIAIVVALVLSSILNINGAKIQVKHKL